MHILEDSSANTVTHMLTLCTRQYVTCLTCINLIHVLCMQLQMRDVSGQLESRVQLLNIKSSSKVNWVSLAVAHRMAGNHELAWQVRSRMACKSCLRLSLAHHKQGAIVHAWIFGGVGFAGTCGWVVCLGSVLFWERPGQMGLVHAAGQHHAIVVFCAHDIASGMERCGTPLQGAEKAAGCCTVAVQCPVY